MLYVEGLAAEEEEKGSPRKEKVSRRIHSGRRIGGEGEEKASPKDDKKRGTGLALWKENRPIREQVCMANT